MNLIGWRDDVFRVTIKNSMIDRNSLANVLGRTVNPDWDSVYECAVQKADSMKFIRDRLNNIHALDSREEEIHYKLLGRLGYNRLKVREIELVENVCFFGFALINNRNLKDLLN